MYPSFFAVVSVNEDVQTILGSNPVRVFPFGSVPERSTLPYAAWQIVGGSPENYITNAPDIDSFVVQVDVYGNTPTDAREAAEALRDAIESSAHIVSWRGENKDQNTGNFRYSFDIEFLTTR